MRTTEDPSRELRSDAAIARLRRSFDDGLAGHAVAAADGRILACNREFARIIGVRSIADAMAVNIHELEPRRGAFANLLERLRDAHNIPLEELTFVRRDGTPAQVLARLAATIDDAGAVVEIRAYLVDITQRYRQEQELRASAERRRLAELATQDVLWDWDVSTARIAWSSATARRFRYTAGELNSSLDWHAERIHPDDRERVLRGVERAILGIGDSWSDEYRFLRGDGSYATVYDRAYVVRNERGEAVRMVGTMIDITDLKSSEESHRFLAAASASLEETLEVNATAAAFAGLAVPGFADFALVDLLQHDGTLRRTAVAHVRPGLDRALGAGTLVEPHREVRPAPLRVVESGAIECMTGPPARDAAAQLAIVDEAGVRAWLTVPIPARDRILGAVTFGYTGERRILDPLRVLTAKDLARRAGLALENGRLYETAQRAIQARNEVLGIVSHDLRVPVSTIMGTLDLLTDSMSERRADVRRWFDILGRATVQIQHLIDDLLDISRLEASAFRIDPTDSDPAALVGEACDTLRHVASASSVSIAQHLARDLPRVTADGPKIVRVIGNLIGNAIKFSPPGGTIVVGASAVDGELLISVRDDGPGIPQAHVPHIFERFWQGSPSDRRGSGLGLAIARGIIDAHGGRIWVETGKSRGSTFTFTLPVAARTPDPAGDGVSRRTPEARAPGPTAARPSVQRSGLEHGASA